MSVKKMIRMFSPQSVHAVIILTLAYFLVQLVFSHTTHALTLLVDSYHVLCKLIYLFGSILCIKVIKIISCIGVSKLFSFQSKSFIKINDYYCIKPIAAQRIRRSMFE